MTLKSSQSRERLTIYLGGSKRQKLLDWARRFTHASSDSEAIFSALDFLREQSLGEFKKDRGAALRKTKGLWSKNSVEIGKAFSEVEKGWADWDRATSL